MSDAVKGYGCQTRNGPRVVTLDPEEESRHGRQHQRKIGSDHHHRNLEEHTPNECARLSQNKVLTRLPTRYSSTPMVSSMKDGSIRSMSFMS